MVSCDTWSSKCSTSNHNNLIQNSDFNTVWCFPQKIEMDKDHSLIEQNTETKNKKYGISSPIIRKELLQKLILN